MGREDWAHRLRAGEVGARVTASTSFAPQTAEVAGGSGYLSANDPRLHVGLGGDAVIVTLAVQWPSGAKDEFKNVTSDSIYTITERAGIKEIGNLPAPK